MQDCSYFENLIDALLDGELSEAEEAGLRAHMEQCGRCSAIFDAYCELSVVMRDSEAPYPLKLHSDIMASVREAAAENTQKPNSKRELAAKTAKRKTHLGTYLALAASLALVLFAGKSVLGGDYIPKAREYISTFAADNGSAAPVEESAEAPVAAEAPAEEAAAAAEEADREIAEARTSAASGIIANVSKIEFFYTGNTVNEFYMHVGDEPLVLTTQITPLSIKDPPTLTSSDEQVLIVKDREDGSCELIARDNGTATVIASYAGFQFECIVHVINDGGFSIDIGIYSFGARVYDITIPLWNSVALSAGYVDDLENVEDPVTWTVSDDKMLSVEPYGERGISITGEKVGTSYVYAEINGLKCKCIVRVFKPESEG